MYIKYKDYTKGDTVNGGDSVLMSLKEFIDGGKDLEGVAITVTPDGNPPVEPSEMDYEI